ncbi:MAG: phosphatase PAP2 family protein [Simkaniaceae bacterium]|nr:phosphatase PAP2 family protein [Simkaniaceae bacterium]
MRWNPKLIISLNFISFALIFSWLYPSTHGVWDAIDLSIFKFLNSWIATSPLFQKFWAYSNANFMDWIHDFAMVSFFIIAFLTAKTKIMRQRRIAQFVICGLVIGATILTFNRGIFKDLVHINRQSPTLVVENSIRLSEHVKTVKIKDKSDQCFPADHATTATLFTAIVFLTLGPTYGFFALFYAVYFCLPRLILGAHWMTDIVMGSVPITLFVTSWVFGSPLAGWVTHKLGGGDEPKREIPETV